MFKCIGKGLVWLYSFIVSPLLPHVCKFKPSCSKYMIESIDKFGLLYGGILGFKRILKCNPKSCCKKDLPKENIKGDYKWVL